MGVNNDLYTVGATYECKQITEFTPSFKNLFLNQNTVRTCVAEKSETYYLYLPTVIQQNIPGAFYSVEKQCNKPPPAKTSWKE